MYRLLLIVSLLVLSSATCNAEFRGLKWGTEKSKVKASMNKKPINSSSEAIIYDEKLLDIKVLLIFLFEHNKLYRGGYFTNTVHEDEIDYLVDYKKIKDALINKYGKPTEDNDIFFIYGNDYTKFVKSVRDKEIKVISKWVLKNKVIILDFSYSDVVSYNTFVTFLKPEDDEKLRRKMKEEEDAKL